MLKQKVKLTVVGDVIPYPTREHGNLVQDENGNDVIAGYRRNLTFESTDFRKDTIPFTLFNDEAKGFNFPEGTDGDLVFLCEIREANGSQEGEKRCYAEFRLINFSPS